jgi:hypothetical protein
MPCGLDLLDSMDVSPTFYKCALYLWFSLPPEEDVHFCKLIHKVANGKYDDRVFLQALRYLKEFTAPERHDNVTWCAMVLFYCM